MSILVKLFSNEASAICQNLFPQIAERVQETQIKNMKNNKISDNNENLKKLALHYMRTLTDVARESFLILDPELRVVLASPTFYQTFRTLPGQTENMFFYKLGNGQWNIPALKRLLEEVLPKKKIVKDYEVKHVFQTIGEKTMLLNARQVDSIQLIILAIEDISHRRELENKLAEHAKGLEARVAEQTASLAERIKELERVNKTMVDREIKMVELKKEIRNLEKLIKNGHNQNGRGKNGNGNGNGYHKNGKRK